MTGTIKIHAMQTGRVIVDSALPFGEKTLHPCAFTGWFRSPAHLLNLPVTTYLIEHPKGLVLVDTGWGTMVRDDQVEYMGEFHHSLNKAELPEGQAIHEQLAKMGIKPADLDYVVCTHLHSDHAGGLQHVREAKKILVSEVEYQYGDRSMKIWRDIPFETFKFEPSPYGPLKQSFDLFKDGSVVFVHTPGHTPGLVSTLVQANGKAFLMFADVGYARKSWENMIMPGVCRDPNQARASLEWVKSMALQADCVEALASHEAASGPHLVTL